MGVALLWGAAMFENSWVIKFLRHSVRIKCFEDMNSSGIRWKIQVGVALLWGAAMSENSRVIKFLRHSGRIKCFEDIKFLRHSIENTGGCRFAMGGGNVRKLAGYEIPRAGIP